jgi:hypothetical protein
MKLYVWNAPYPISYGGSCLYVLAPNLTAARKNALQAVDCGFGEPFGDNRVIRLEKLGEPSRVLTAPYAEVFWWSE